MVNTKSSFRLLSRWAGGSNGKDLREGRLMSYRLKKAVCESNYGDKGL